MKLLLVFFFGFGFSVQAHAVGAYIVCEFSDLESSKSEEIYSATARKYERPVEAEFDVTAGKFRAKGKYHVEGHAWDLPYSNSIVAEIMNAQGEAIASLSANNFNSVFEVGAFVNGKKVSSFKCTPQYSRF